MWKCHESTELTDMSLWVLVRDNLLSKGFVLINKSTREEIRNPDNNHLIAVYYFPNSNRVPEGGWVMNNVVDFTI